MRSSAGLVRPPGQDETIAPVTILDGQGRVVRVVPAAVFRRSGPASRGHWRERGRRLPGPVSGTTGRDGAERR
jgi:hypothetical protein